MRISAHPPLIQFLFLLLLSGSGVNGPFLFAGAGPLSIEDGLLANARTILEEIRTHEAGKDATCWTTVRTMENFYSHKMLDEAAVLTLIEGRKQLVFEIWQNSIPRTALATTLRQGDLAPATARLRALKRQTLLDNPIKMNMGHDYDRVTENWRVISSLIGERLAGVGRFAAIGGGVASGGILPLDDGARAELGGLSTQLTVMLLDSARSAADAADHASVTSADMLKAISTVQNRLGISGGSTLGDATTVPNKRPDTKQPPKPAQHNAELRELTLANMDGKISALKVYNGSFWQDASKPKDLASLFNQIASVPVTPEAADKIAATLKQFAAIPGYGVDTHEAMTYRAANLFGYISDLGKWAKEQSARGLSTTYLQLSDIANFTADVFPHQLLANGDIKLQLIAPPVIRIDQVRKFEHLLGDVVMTSTDLDAFRDVILHWQILRDVWQDQAMRPLDPFGAELLSERVSELAVLMLRLGERQARHVGEKSVNGAVMDFVMKQEIFLAPGVTQTDEWVKRDPKVESQIFAAFGKRDPFRDDTARAGFSATTCGVKVRSDAPNLQNFMGSGVAVGDLEGTGLLDVFVAGDGCNRLYKNLGKGKFQDVTATYGLDDSEYDSRQALFADLDNDGTKYLFVVHSNSPSRLFHFGNDRRFHDVSAESGIKTALTAHAAFFFDYNNDGLLDLFVGHYGPKVAGQDPTIDGRNGTGNQLYKNLGHGHFVDVSAEAGIVGSSWTLAAAAFDFNHDGCQDIFVANDWGKSQLYINDCKGHFSEKSDLLGIEERGSGMNASFIDVNSDGYLGIYLSVIDMFSKSLHFVLPRPGSLLGLNDHVIKTASYFSGNKLLANDHGKRLIPTETKHFDGADKGWAWSAAFFDYANKGAEDLYLANGWIPDSLAGKQSNKFFVNEHGKFIDMSARTPIGGFPGYSRAVAAVDLTGDGKSDLLVTGLGMRSNAGVVEPTLHYLRNLSTSGNHWLKIRPRGVRNNRDGVGAEISVFTPDGKRQTKLVSSGINYLAQEGTTQTFGIGKNSKVSKIEVRWPGRKNPQVVTGKFPIDHTVEVREDASHEPNG